MRAGSLAVMGVFALGILAGTSIPPARRPVLPVSAPDRVPEPLAGKTAIKGVYAAEALRVIDGDTFEARVHLWPASK